MDKFKIVLSIARDACFGSGEGIPGYIDIETLKDEYGMPYLDGKAIKGILTEESSNIIYSLELQKNNNLNKFIAAHEHLWGTDGTSLDKNSILHIGPASLPQNIRDSLISALKKQIITKEEVFESLTTTRTRTSINEKGGSEHNSLRTIRMLLRETKLISEIDCQQDLSFPEKGLLAATVMAFRRAGLNRNRGCGKLQAQLWKDNQDITSHYYALLKQEVTAHAS